MRRAFWTVAVLLGLSGIVILAGASRHYGGNFWGQENAAWWQAAGSVLAVLSGFAVMQAQTIASRQDQREEKSAAARAAYGLAEESMTLVADRLLVAAKPFSGKEVGLMLREYRTTEMVAALRELEISSLPPELVVPFARVRRDLHAVNSRVSELYRSEEQGHRREDERGRRIASSLRTYDLALRAFLELQQLGEKHSFPRSEFTEPTVLRELVAAATVQSVPPSS